eukprot:jgi/Galph1/3807/GphlegSOOS_G2484.1
MPFHLKQPYRCFLKKRIETIALGELVDKILVNEQVVWNTNPIFGGSLLLVRNNFIEEIEGADTSSSLLRRPSEEYHRGSTQKKPFYSLASQASFLREDEDSLWRSNFSQALCSAVEEISKQPLTAFHVEKTDGLVHSTLLEKYIPDDETIRQLELNRARYASESGDYYVIGDETSRAPVQASLKQDKSVGKNIFSFSKEDLRLFGVLKEQLALSADKDKDSNVTPNSVSGKVSGDLKSPMLTKNAESLSVEQLHERIDIILQSQENDVDSILAKTRQRKIIENEEEWATIDREDISDFSHLVPALAWEFPFTLDDFQKRAILHLEREENLFVSAHTSAGKTVVAEYAIALSIQHQTKCIYTSPIKTLSNQKYRDFLEKFSDVGIITGDISIHPDASCLIVTTEILRSMLYKGADLIRDIEFVVFDEVHYINDEERGVVWEEVIILLPARIKVIMLSATVPNALDFAKWVGRTRQKKVFVVSTDHRPVPLEHSALVKGELFTLMDSKGQFLSESYKKLSQVLKEENKGFRSNIRIPNKTSWSKLVNFLKKKQLTPAVVFCFSKRRCEEAAESLQSQDLTEGSSEKSVIHQFVEYSLARLRKEDRQLPQIERMKEMLKRGIAIHHAGILPIMKENVEILFQRGLVRVLFATETFSMGVNMPARTVVFSSLRKHDGRSFRYLEPGEYIQMAGRAGRRGLDAIGNVIIYLSDELPDAATLKHILTGPPIRLNSRFRLTYSMIINLLRVEDLRVEDMIRRSFGEAASTLDVSLVPKLLSHGKKKLAQLEQKLQEEVVDEALGLSFEDFQHYYLLCDEIRKYNEFFLNRLWSIPGLLSRYLSPGRLIQILDENFRLVTGLIIGGVEKLALKGTGNILESSLLEQEKANNIVVLMVINNRERGIEGNESSFSENLIERGNVGDYTWTAKKSGNCANIGTFTECRVAIFLPLRGGVNHTEVKRSIDYMRRISTVTRLHPRKDMNVADFDIETGWEQRESMIRELSSSNVTQSQYFESFLQRLDEQHRLLEKINSLQWMTSDESLQLMPDYAVRIQILRKLEFINEENVVQLKGRAACEINSCDSLLVTEVVFENLLENLDAAECQGSSEVTEFELLPVLEETLEKVKKLALSLGTIQAECGLPVSPAEYLRQNIQTALTQVVLWWARGESFSEICNITDIPEGSVVRNINRLSELMKELKNVARVIGNPTLYQKLTLANESIRRDICFAASLYVS